MNKDLNLSGFDYSWVVTVFYFGQMAGTFLSAYFISRFPVVKVVGITMYGTLHPLLLLLLLLLLILFLFLFLLPRSIVSVGGKMLITGWLPRLIIDFCGASARCVLRRP